ncbi:hypothetical protein R6Q57_018092 [Mikania cordata]
MCSSSFLKHHTDEEAIFIKSFRDIKRADQRTRWRSKSRVLESKMQVFAISGVNGFSYKRVIL